MSSLRNFSLMDIPVNTNTNMTCQEEHTAYITTNTTEYKSDITIMEGKLYIKYLKRKIKTLLKCQLHFDLQVK